MFFEHIVDNSTFTWVILPILIFISRIFDVSIGTVRIIFVSRSKKFLAPLLGFFEVAIWLLAISQIMSNLDNILCFIAYAGGFATGNFIGIIIEEKLAIGTLVVRVFLVKDDSCLKEQLYSSGFGVTSIHASGRMGAVEIVYTIIKRRNLEQVIKIIENCNLNAFYSVEEVKDVKQGIFPKADKSINRKPRFIRPGK